MRRQSDVALMNRVRQLEAMADRRHEGGAKEAERQRRRAIRHTCKVAIERLLGHAAGVSEDWSVDAIRIKGKLLDLSLEGASIFTQDAMDTGQQLRLMIELRDRTRINTAADVRWVKAIPEKGGYASGVHFKHVDPPQRKRLAKFLNHLDDTAGL